MIQTIITSQRNESKRIFLKEKLSKIIPICKSNDFIDMNNFRPIVLLNVVHMMIEKDVKDQFIYLNIVGKCKYGFRSNKHLPRK